MLLLEQGSEIFELEASEDVFLIRPYVPAFSTCILYGMPTLGKTPIAWAMAEAIATGGFFLGTRAMRGNALVIEVDMPLTLVRSRWKHANPPFRPHFSIFFDATGLDSFQLGQGWKDKRHTEVYKVLKNFDERHRPCFVAVDSLRKVVRGDINPPGIADRVYDAWHSLFPAATILFVHHESKDKDSLVATDPLQKAKGTMEFVDIAQVAMRLSSKPDGTYLSVTKTQASEIPDPRKITLKDGVYVS